MQILEESCNFEPVCQVFHVHKSWKRKKMGEKEEINSSEANTIPNSQYNINFGWWLTFILFCLDEQIYYKKHIGSWLHRLLAKSVIVPDKKNKYIYIYKN